VLAESHPQPVEATLVAATRERVDGRERSFFRAKACRRRGRQHDRALEPIGVVLGAVERDERAHRVADDHELSELKLVRQREHVRSGFAASEMAGLRFRAPVAAQVDEHPTETLAIEILARTSPNWKCRSSNRS
jgi:hypothetical protein